MYSNYLIEEGFDVLEIKNAKNFDYLNTNIIVHNKDKINIAKKNIAKKLNINHIKINENGIWDLSIIIGKDYRKLDSFNTVKNIILPFNMSEKKIVNRISELMLDKKALDIKIIDVIGLTSLTDYFINCELTI